MKTTPDRDAILLSYAAGVGVGLLREAPPLSGVGYLELAFVGYERAPLVLGVPFDWLDDDDRWVRRIETAGPLAWGPVLAPANGPITHVGLFSSLTVGAGTLRRVLALASPVPAPSLGLLTIAAGKLALHEA